MKILKAIALLFAFTTIHDVNAAPSYPEPTDNEIFRIVCNQTLRDAPRGNNVVVNESDCSVTQDMAGFGVGVIKVSSVEKLGCEPAVGRPGYRCDFQVTMGASQGGSSAAINAYSASMLNAFINGKVINKSGYFIKKNSTWYLLEQ